jgi:hypothetical protein
VADRPRGRRSRSRSPLAGELGGESLLDALDLLISKGVVLDGEIVLGLADIDLVYVRLGALLAAADRVLEPPADGTAGASSDRPRPSAGAVSRGAAVAPVPSPAPTQGRTAPPAPRMSLTTPDETSRSVMKLVLTLVELVRQLLERQAVRRVRERTLTPAEVERLGTRRRGRSSACDLIVNS